MKKVINLLLVSFITLLPVSGQVKTDRPVKSRDTYLGFYTGICFSTLKIPSYSGDENTPMGPHGQRETISFNNQSSDELFIGGLLITRYSRHFSLQLDGTYKKSKHDFNYDTDVRLGSINRIQNINYKIKYSNLFLSLLPSFHAGDSMRIVFFAGPFVDIIADSEKSAEISYTTYNYVTNERTSGTSTQNPSSNPLIDGGVGIAYGIRLEFPIKTSCLGFEFRGWLKPYQNIKKPDLKEQLFALTVMYNFRIRHVSDN